MTLAADRFTDSVLESWDSFDCYESTLRLGLSDTDSDALWKMCQESGDNYTAAESEVLAWIRKMVDHLSRVKDDE